MELRPLAAAGGGRAYYARRRGVYVVIADVRTVEQPAFGAALLTDAERRRRSRMRRPLDAQAFVAGCALLRRLVARRPGDRIELGAHGRPALVGRDLSFSLSRDAPWVGLAVSRDRTIGFDLQGAPRPPRVGAPPLVFSPRERRAFRDACARGEPDAFLTGWTRKEAVLKALGVGLGEAWRAEVDFAGVTPHPLLTVDASSDTASAWTVEDLRVPNELVAAVAIAPPAPGRSATQSSFVPSSASEHPSNGTCSRRIRLA